MLRKDVSTKKLAIAKTLILMKMNKSCRSKLKKSQNFTENNSSNLINKPIC